ncbi:hypothetical protein BDZ91DRAFT_746472 [Kalaharituber pfeilii]|nr:hypothetical protein BDZ91DRAFT_746472 [Kalaharituber pfeilii]
MSLPKSSAVDNTTSTLIGPDFGFCAINGTCDNAQIIYYAHTQSEPGKRRVELPVVWVTLSKEIYAVCGFLKGNGRRIDFKPSEHSIAVAQVGTDKEPGSSVEFFVDHDGQPKFRPAKTPIKVAKPGMFYIIVTEEAVSDESLFVGYGRIIIADTGTGDDENIYPLAVRSVGFDHVSRVMPHSYIVRFQPTDTIHTAIAQCELGDIVPEGLTNSHEHKLKPAELVYTIYMSDGTWTKCEPQTWSIGKG